MDFDTLQLYSKEIVSIFVGNLKTIRNYVNYRFDGVEPLIIILSTIAVLISIYTLYEWLHCILDEDVSQKMWYILRQLPIIKQSVAKKLKSTSDEIESHIHSGMEDVVFHKHIPRKSYKSDKILQEIERYFSYGQFAYKEGYVSGAVYLGNDDELVDLMANVYKLTAYSNPLHPDIFPGIRIMEAEIVQMVSALYGNFEPVGTVTNGGTESIFLVCKAYRDYAKFKKGIKEPNMVIPLSAHAAFDKAAQLLKIKTKHVKLDPATSKVDMKSMKKAIDKNTIMLVGSAPSFPYGSIDPIEEIAKLGHRNKIPVHVDACLGGFLIPFMEKAGFKIPDFDFSVEGVTSISADTHKYAYAPKGTSVIMYKDKIYRHFQFSVLPDWPGGIYATPNLPGSRSGGLIATCWASLLYHGEESYIENTKNIISTTKYIEKGIREIEEIYIIGKPEVSVIAIGSKHFDIYRLTSALTDRGWNLNVLQFPSAFHICLTVQHTYKGVADRFLLDIKECTEEIMKSPGVATSGTAAIYGMAQQIPDRSLVSEISWAYLDACYSTNPNEKLVRNHSK